MEQPETEPAAESARCARRLMRSAPTAALATSLVGEAAPWPFASLVLSATDHDGAPLLLLSHLAEHSRNIARDARISLLYDGTGGRDDPLTGSRVSVLGRAAPSAEARHRARFLARHPSAARYADFKDFMFYRVEPVRAHLVAGFGRIAWLEAPDLLREAAGLREAEADIVRHMNEDHADAVALYATALLGRADGPWRMTGLDPEGCDLRAGGASARLDFEAPIGTAREAREVLVRLAHDARRGTES